MDTDELQTSVTINKIESAEKVAKNNNEKNVNKNKNELIKETKDLIRKRASIKKRSQRNQNVEYVKLRKLIKRRIRWEKINFNMKKIREELENSKSLKQVRRNDNGRIWMTLIIDEKGKILTDKTNIG